MTQNFSFSSHKFTIGGIFKQKKKIIFIDNDYSLERSVKMEYINAFWVGGLICVVGQLLIDKTKLTPARILTSFVVAGVILGAVGLYEPLANFAGAGASVPISGFGYLMSDGIKEALKSDGALGILTGALTSAAAGITAAIFFGLIAGLCTRSGDK